LDSTCSACGGSQSLLDDASTQGGDWSDGLTDNILKEVDHEIKSVEEELADALDMAGSDMATATRSQPLAAIGAKPTDWKMGRLAPPDNVATASSQRTFAPIGQEDVHQAAQLVFFSRHVQTNIFYRERAAQTSVIYAQEDEAVNAFATDQVISSLPVEPPMIILFGGISEAVSLAALALGLAGADDYYNRSGFLADKFQLIGRKMVAHAGRMPPEVAAEIRYPMLGNIETRGRDTVERKARSFEAAMLLTVIAHELGHICLGHTLGVSANNEISRNQEREADSFAASITASSPFSDYIVSGGIFWWVIMTWAAESIGPHAETSHPHSRERLMDYIRANKSQAKDIGITQETIQAYLPG